MLTTTHLAAVLLLGLLLNLDRNEWFAALAFGVALDVDHLFAAPGYVERNGFAAILKPSWDDGSGIPWRSVLHYPMGAFLVIPLSVGWRLLLPLLFWLTHLAIDYVQSVTLAYSAVVESAFLASVCLGIFAFSYQAWAAASSDHGLRPFLRYVKEYLRSSIYGPRRANRGTAGRS